MELRRLAAIMGMADAAEYYGNRGGGALVSLGASFYEIHPSHIVPLGGLPVQLPPGVEAPASPATGD